MALETGVAILNCETKASIFITNISKEIAHTARWCSSEVKRQNQQDELRNPNLDVEVTPPTSRFSTEQAMPVRMEDDSILPLDLSHLHLNQSLQALFTLKR